MKTAARIAQLQVLVGVVGALVGALVSGASAVAPAACGGAIAALLTFYTALKTFGREPGEAVATVRNFYAAQARKWALAIVLFGVAVQMFGSNFAPLISTFAVAQLVYWLALLWD